MPSDSKTQCLINGVQYNCRTCFEPGRTIYPLTDVACDMKTLRDLLKDIAQLETYDEELLPNTLCCNCLDKLKKSYDFVLQIHGVNEKYKQLLQKDVLLNEVDSFTDCLAESAIALPLEQCMPEIKMEEELVVSYDNNSSDHKLQKESEATFENEVIDDPFTEIFDDVSKSISKKLEDNKSNRTLTESDDDDSNDDNYNDDDYNPSRSLTERSDDDSNDDDDSGPTSATLSSESESDGIYRKRLRRKITTAAITAGVSTAKQCRPSQRKGDSRQCESNLDQENKLSCDELNWLFGYRLYSKPTAWRLVQCKLCNTNFKTCRELRQHLKGHSDVGTLCNLDLTDNIIQYLFPNMINLDIIKKSICRDIKKKQWFKYYVVLNEYSYEMSISDTEVEELEEESLKRVRKYKCVLCAQEFSYKYQIFLHLKQYHSKDEAPFKCDRCTLEFASDKIYKQHLQTHCRNNDKGLLCGLCPCKFVWPENIKNHKCATKLLKSTPVAAPKHQEPLEQRSLIAIFRCCLCELSFKKLKHLRQHMTVHADGKTSIDFKNCTYIKQFESSKPIDYKMLEQQIQNDYQRRQISRFYQAMDKYGNEMDISDSESESDTDTESRNEEGDSENIENTYKCKLCKETFQKRKYVLMHQEERHIDMEMPFNCEVCNQQYINVDLLLQHLKRECKNEYRQLGEQCEFCNVRFVWPNHLLKHKEIQHYLVTEPFNSISSCDSSTLPETVTTTQPLGISSCGSSASSETVSSVTDEESNNYIKIKQLATADMFKESRDRNTSSNDSVPNNKQIENRPLSKLKSAQCMCSFCGVSFSSLSTLKDHIKKLHKDEKPFKCSHCQMSFTQASDLKSHTLLTHPDKQSFKCSFCQKTFSQKPDLIIHKRIHKGEKETQCSICQKSYTTPSNMRQHMLSHMGERPYECDICGQKFYRNTYLKTHRRITGHAPTDGIILKTPNSNPTTKKRLCPICGVYLNTNLKLHMRIHTGEKPYKCDFCEMAFTRRSNLVYHRRTHTNERPFKCPHCDKGFPISQRLKKHLLTHTGERPYQCKICKGSFNSDTYLKIHMSCHTGEKIFKCEICDVAFVCSGYLSKHRNSKGHQLKEKLKSEKDLAHESEC